MGQPIRVATLETARFQDNADGGQVYHLHHSQRSVSTVSYFTNGDGAVPVGLAVSALALFGPQ